MLKTFIEKFNGLGQFKNLLIWLVLFLLVLVVYFPSLFLGFFSDDYHLLYVVFQDPHPWHYLKSNVIGEFGYGTYGPIFDWLMILQYKLFGLKSIFYHLFNLILHSLNGLLVYLLAKKIIKKDWLAFFSSLIFLLMHNQVSAVVWVAILPHLAATFFYLLSLYLFWIFLEENKLRYYFLALLSIILSLLTKEIAITFIVIFVLAALFFSRKNSWSSKLKLIFKINILPLIILLTYLKIRLVIVGQLVGYYGNEHLDFALGKMYKMFIQLIANLFFDYPWRVKVADWLLMHNWLVLLIFLLLIIIIGNSKSRKKELMFLFLSFLTLTLPFLQLLLNPLNDGGERYTYLISTFFVILFVALSSDIVERLKLSRLGYIIIGVLLVVVNCLAIQPKLNNWVKGGQVVRGITNSASQLNWDNKYALFIGLPDNLQGTELFRNAIKEAIFLERGIKIEGERLPVYSVLNSENYQQDYFRLDKISVGELRLVVSDSKKGQFTGFPEFKGELGSVYLEDYQKYDTGSSILLKINKGKLEELKKQGRDLLVVYYNNLKLQAVAINNL